MSGLSARSNRTIAEEIRKLKFPKIDFDEFSTRKVAIARRLRKETTVSLRWIADQLNIGSVRYAAKLIKKC